MKSRDDRSRDEILQHPRWDPFFSAPGLSEIDVSGLRILDAFFAFMEGENIASIRDLSKRHFQKFDPHNETVERLRRLKKAMNIMFAGEPSILVLTKVIREKEAAYEAKKKRPPKSKPRSLKYSVPESELPPEWRSAFADMAAGMDRNGQMAPATGMYGTHVMKMRQLLCSARKAQLPKVLSRDTVLAYAHELYARGVAPATQRASYSAVLKFARYTAADQATIELLAELCRTYEKKAGQAAKQKYAKLQKTGYSPVPIVDRAAEMLKSLPKNANTQADHAQRNRAAALALFAVLPLRLADTRLVFGETLLWKDGHYTIETHLSKSKALWTTDLNPYLNLFIDALILRGCASLWLDTMRQDCLQQKRPLFITSTGEAVGYNYVSDAWRRELGTGEHIARTILHTYFGIEYGMAGVEMAKAACGQTAQGIEKEYQDNSLKKVQRLQGQSEITAISEAFDDDPFALT